MLNNLVKNLRDWNYRTGLDRRAKAGKFNTRRPPQWLFSMPFDSAKFNSRALATQFSAKYPGAQAITIDSYPSRCIEPATMRWIIEQRARGVDTGPLAARIMCAHPESFDDVLAWFEREPDPAAAFQLLDFAFSLGRTEATNTVAAWAAENTNRNNGFFSPTALDRIIEDPFGINQDSAHEICLFGRLIRRPMLMQWFFENQLELKYFIQDPVQWAALQEGLHIANPASITAWPAAAYQTFGHHENPLQEHWPERPMHNSIFVRNTIQSYAHSPAAQSYLVHCHINYQANQDLTQYMVAEASPEVMELYHRMVEKIDSRYTRLIDFIKPYDNDKVEGLMLGLHLGMDSTEFYYHAQAVLDERTLCDKPKEFVDLDPTIFALW